MVRQSSIEEENDELTYFDTEKRKSSKMMQKTVTANAPTTMATAGSTTNPYQLIKFDKTSTIQSNASRKTSYSDNASDIVDADYVDKNIPKMELLKINYVSRSRNNLTQIDDNDSIACSSSVQLRAKKRNHPKQQLYQRSHSDGLLKVSELAKLSNCNNNANNAINNNGARMKSMDPTPAPPSSVVSSMSQSSKSSLSSTTSLSGHGAITPKSQPIHIQNSNGHPQNPLKYTVYKKHNSSDTVAAMKSEKLQYTNDDAIFKNAKKKYSMFDGKKRNSMETIQFYFDSKSYERHVDNKMYGILMSNCNDQQQQPSKSQVKRLAPAAPPPPPPPPSVYENKWNSWNFVKATKSLLNGSQISRMASGQKYIKNVPSSKKVSRDLSLMDLTRIGQLFRENRRASADDLLDGGRISIPDFGKRCTSTSTSTSETDYENKTASTTKKVKKLSAEFENKCLCNGKLRQQARKSSAPAHLISESRCTLSENCAKLRQRFEYPVAMADMSRSPSPPPTIPPKNVSRLVKQFGSMDEENSDKSSLYLLKKTRSKSISSIENERRKTPEHRQQQQQMATPSSIGGNVSLFGHLHQVANCLAAKTCGYKNCTFTNCPMSSITAALSNVNRNNNDKINGKAHINGKCNGNGNNSIETTLKSNADDCNKKQTVTPKCPNNISITKIDTISNKSKLYLKTKDFMDDDNSLTDFQLSPVNDDGITLNNNLKNLKNTTTNLNVNDDPNSATTIPIKFTPNQQNLNNSMKCKSVEKLDFNSTSHIENQKFNNNSKSNSNVLVLPEMSSFSKNEDDNRVKIFIRNPVPAAAAIEYPSASNPASPIYGTSSSAESLASDYYYDSVMGDCEPHMDFVKKFERIQIDDDDDDDDDDKKKTQTIDVPAPNDTNCDNIDFGIKPTTNLMLTSNALKHSNGIDLIRQSKKNNLNNMFPSRLGCDGAIFWNDCYYYDEHNGCEYCNKSNDMCTCAMPIMSKCSVENDEQAGNGDADIDVNDNDDDDDDDDDDDNDLDDGYDEKQIDGSSSRPQSMEGPMDSGISLNGDTISSPDSDNSSQHHMQNQNDIETKKDFCSKRCHVLTELLETERIYVAEMGSILRGYRDRIHSEEMASLVPPGLHGKEDILFGNLNELYTFHSEVFLKDLENCISTTELVALCFVQRRDTFYRLYSFYCQNIPRSERLRETLVDTHLFLQECQKRLGHKLPLAAYLLKPVQRITKYQLLLKDLLRFSDNGTCAKELQKALDCMLIVLKCVNDSMHQIAITGFPADLTQQGDLLLQDSFQVWTESKKDIRLRLRTQQRHIFLYQKAMLFCKQASKTGHNKSTYQFKHYVKMSQIGLTESVRGDPKRFEVWLQGRSEVHTIQAMTIDIKNKWVAEIKKVLLNQLEELKDENFKQYGLRSLRQTVSWDTPTTLTAGAQRALSIDTNSTNSNETNRCSNISDESGPITTAAPISSSSSEHDNHEAGAWSSDYSNSEDEYPNGEDTAPGNRFISLADYCAMGHSEVSMKVGDTVELLKIGCAGWWYVKILSNNAEGWAPAAFLDPINRRTQRSNSKQIEQT